MANRPFGGRNQDRQQLYPQTPEPAPAPAVPVVSFATPEAHATITGPLREKYETAVTFANAEWEQAFKAQADIDGWLAEIDDLRKRIDARTLDKQQHLHHAQQGCDVANPASALLALAGVHVPQIATPPAVTSPAPAIPALHVADLKVHPADAAHDTSQASSMENPPVGHCINCGKDVWRVERSETSPHGLTHGWGASCYPESKTSTYADMGEDRVAS